MVTVKRTDHSLTSRDGRSVLEQRFRFEGQRATADAIAEILMTAPLVGEGSIFGRRPGTEGIGSQDSRTLKDFSPVVGFQFDVDMRREGAHSFVVRFSQPGRRVPYLQGDAVWTLLGSDDGVTFDEQINTAAALGLGKQPLDGPRLSLRRWLFFRVGHKQVMAGATKSIAGLLG